ncbi:MAG: nucleotide exchange factor GrpE [Bacilli bacterium]
MKKSKEEKDKKQRCDECENPDINVDENLEEVSSDNDNLCDQSEEEILILKNNIENLEEKIKLTQAELINYRKRKDEETSNMLKYANMDLIVELLPVLDNFERALNMKNEFKDFDKYTEGYKLLYNHLVDTLKKFGVEEIPALGLEFDPNLHEAVMIGSDEEKENDIILEVFNKGYMLKGRVIRPSKVKVNKID